MTTSVTITNNGPKAIVIATQTVAQDQGNDTSAWTPLITLPASEQITLWVASPGGTALSVTEEV